MSTPAASEYQLVIHGGAGTIRRSSLSDEMEAAIHAALRSALSAGESILQKGGTALDAVQAAVISMEDCEHFNAGKGAVFNADGKHEMEAAIMDGKSLQAGSVLLISALKNPITAARLVMERSDHVTLSGRNAEAFAEGHGAVKMPASYFSTERRWEALQRVKQLTDKRQINEEDRHGTVGAVARDRNGNIAAATSTGGTTNKFPGRIGDTPIIGASTWADSKTGGISTTGQGEHFMRLAAARDIAALIEYKSLTIEAAANIVIHEKLRQLGGNGGIIGIDHLGNIAMVFNAEGMYRGFADGLRKETYIYQ